MFVEKGLGNMTKKICGALLLAASGMATGADVALPQKLTIGWLQGPDALSVIGYCIPEFKPEQLDELRRSSARATAVFAREGNEASPYLIASGDRMACIDRNGAARPLLPAGIYAKMIKFDGASEQTTNTLFDSLSRQIALRGAADALVKFPNGNAYEIALTVAEDAPVEILYSTNFLKAGEYDESKYRIVVADQIRSVSMTSYGSGRRRAVGILQDELAPRPLRGEHLLTVGNDLTANFSFEDTAWNFSSAGTVRLRAGGVVTYQPKRGEETSGAWSAENGALYFNYGKVFGSAILDEKDKLFVEFRNPQAGPEKKERRWTATLKRGWF